MDIRERRLLLLEKQARLQQEQKRRLNASKGDAEDLGSDAVDQTSSREGKEETWRAWERAGNELCRVNTALQLIDKGWTGECLTCTGEISEQRVQALPEATRCVGCAETAGAKPPLSIRKPERRRGRGDQTPYWH